MHEDPAIADGERWRMDHLRQLAELRGYFLRREAIEIGVDDRALTLGVRRGVYVRIRQGAYCHTDLWQAKSPVDCHLARSYAAQDLTPGPTALSHVSALAHYGCPLWEAPLDLVHLTRLDQGSSRREAGVVHHDGQVAEKDVVRREGRRVTSPTRSTLDALTILSLESSYVAGDWMLEQGLTTHDELWAGKEAMAGWPRTLPLHVRIGLLDGRSQSVAESRGRRLFKRMGLPTPELQYCVYDKDGRLIAITDFAWPEYNVFGEIDGKVKYGRLLKPGQDPGDVVFAEKRREDAVRRTTNGIMVRFTWSDLHARSAPALQLLHLLRRTA